MAEGNIIYMLVKLFYCDLTSHPTTVPAGRKTAIKFDVEKLFEQTRRTAREYSQQASGEERVSFLGLRTVQ